mmetsp:Transcript_93876/g.251215  ORF Transcript_93876/g.251215 Transcript_93876/m.251215 type:complete len:1221 (+) Transcript_93876:91-3753(+)
MLNVCTLNRAVLLPGAEEGVSTAGKSAERSINLVAVRCCETFDIVVLALFTHELLVQYLPKANAQAVDNAPRCPENLSITVPLHESGTQCITALDVSPDGQLCMVATMNCILHLVPVVALLHGATVSEVWAGEPGESVGLLSAPWLGRFSSSAPSDQLFTEAGSVPPDGGTVMLRFTTPTLKSADACVTTLVWWTQQAKQPAPATAGAALSGQPHGLIGLLSGQVVLVHLPTRTEVRVFNLPHAIRHMQLCCTLSREWAIIETVLPACYKVQLTASSKDDGATTAVAVQLPCDQEEASLAVHVRGLREEFEAGTVVFRREEMLGMLVQSRADGAPASLVLSSPSIPEVALAQITLPPPRYSAGAGSRRAVAAGLVGTGGLSVCAYLQRRYGEGYDLVDQTLITVSTARASSAFEEEDPDLPGGASNVLLQEFLLSDKILGMAPGRWTPWTGSEKDEAVLMVAWSLTTVYVLRVPYRYIRGALMGAAVLAAESDGPSPLDIARELPWVCRGFGFDYSELLLAAGCDVIHRLRASIARPVGPQKSDRTPEQALQLAFRIWDRRMPDTVIPLSVLQSSLDQIMQINSIALRKDPEAKLLEVFAPQMLRLLIPHWPKKSAVLEGVDAAKVAWITQTATVLVLATHEHLSDFRAAAAEVTKREAEDDPLALAGAWHWPREWEVWIINRVRRRLTAASALPEAPEDVLPSPRSEVSSGSSARDAASAGFNSFAEDTRRCFSDWARSRWLPSLRRHRKSNLLGSSLSVGHDEDEDSTDMPPRTKLVSLLMQDFVVAAEPCDDGCQLRSGRFCFAVPCSTSFVQAAVSWLPAEDWATDLGATVVYTFFSLLIRGGELVATLRDRRAGLRDRELAPTPHVALAVARQLLAQADGLVRRIVRRALVCTLKSVHLALGGRELLGPTAMAWEWPVDEKSAAPIADESAESDGETAVDMRRERQFLARGLAPLPWNVDVRDDSREAQLDRKAPVLASSILAWADSVASQRAEPVAQPAAAPAASWPASAAAQRRARALTAVYAQLPADCGLAGRVLTTRPRVPAWEAADPASSCASLLQERRYHEQRREEQVLAAMTETARRIAVPRSGPGRPAWPRPAVPGLPLAFSWAEVVVALQHVLTARATAELREAPVSFEGRSDLHAKTPSSWRWVAGDAGGEPLAVGGPVMPGEDSDDCIRMLAATCAAQDWFWELPWTTHFRLLLRHAQREFEVG